MCQDIALGSMSKEWLTQNQDNVSGHSIRDYEQRLVDSESG
jgi:hypothetical protein